ncbi:hsp70-Hsp90 organizing protein 1 isoform X2 [Daucus carota subsp. sativus]|uniref:hsp70-Hsp90 organizing protein 1 isoform X2 n=1 Tax=Daucus carota subsp. sativus TaxID=79200 RepID=UPI0007EF56B3|nr:PREDICTED: hsp70-Hsp90 organizing protein 1-like isoform X2 [Daucus carota subsp. sativus]XP_017235204.1 PREDICTED: hsp70-Hsp90 organizing protein 1-like isoform X2 [Daucus carota subsp. sativus]
MEAKRKDVNDSVQSTRPIGGELPQSASKFGDCESIYVLRKACEVDDSDEDDMDDVEDDMDEEIVESDVEVEGGSVEPDNDPPHRMGDLSVEVSEENRIAAQEAKGKAVEATSEGKYEEAIEHLTQAILLNPASAMMYATRAAVYIMMKKPNAAIRDANAALEINPDSAKGYKSRGMARAMLGQWEVAANDLHVASNIDYDEEISSVLKKVEPIVLKIKEHQRRYARLRKESEDRKSERHAEAQKACEGYDSNEDQDDADEDDSDENDIDEVEEVEEATHKTLNAEEEEEIVESDIELEGETVEPDDDPLQKMGDPSIEVNEENRDAAQEAKRKAMEAVCEGNHEEAIELLTQAILLNPTSAMMYATRATVYIKMKKPNAAIQDAHAALEINPDSAKGHKSRGMARAMLGQWEEAVKDLHVASSIDHDEEISAALKKVEPNAHKIEEHRQKYDRLHKEREERKAESERKRRKAEAQAAYKKAKRQEKASSSKRSGGMRGGFPGS